MISGAKHKLELFSFIQGFKINIKISKNSLSPESHPISQAKNNLNLINLLLKTIAMYI
jgi:hypothetical protein